MLLFSRQINRADEARQRLTGSYQQKGIIFQMADSSNISDVFLSQVQVLAPSIHQLLNSKAARITAAVTSHDVVNGYGHGFTFHLKLELLIEQCLTCFETATSRPTFDCRWHRFEKRFMQIADAEAPTLEKALRKLEAVSGLEQRRAA